MPTLTVDLWTCDVGTPVATPVDFAELLVTRTLQSWDEGADIVLFPEFTWMGLERFVAKDNPLSSIAHLFWSELWPSIRERLDRPNKAVILGTVPWKDGATEEIRNRAPILSDGRELYQDKLNLTPWENAFSPGAAVRIWKLGDARLAVVICLDIEIPELSALLRGKGVDAILVPSATETIFGLDRVGRCASARAIELGCYVGVSHLVGVADFSALVDENVGRLAWFAPSQAAFADVTREALSEILTEGFHRQRQALDTRLVALSRRNYLETNPARLTPRHVNCEDTTV